MATMCTAKCSIGYYDASEVTDLLFFLFSKCFCLCSNHSLILHLSYAANCQSWPNVWTRGFSLCFLLQDSKSESEKLKCRACHPSCLGCRGPGIWKCTMCHAGQLLSDDGRCLTCCGNEIRHKEQQIPRECCNCKSSQCKWGVTLRHWLPANTPLWPACVIFSVKIPPLAFWTHTRHTCSWKIVFKCVWILQYIWPYLNNLILIQPMDEWTPLPVNVKAFKCTFNPWDILAF